jgi:cholesterol transport system auxiliary component
MMQHTLKRSAVGSVCAAGLALSGCALVSRGDTLHMRYFTLDSPSAHQTAQPAHAHAGSNELELRLGRIDASGGLDQQLAVRTGANELSYRDEERWTERPAQYVRRGLERALFQERGLTRAYSGDAPTLDVELVELEVELAPTPKARVRLLSHLHDHRRGLCDETQAQEQSVAGKSEVQAEVVAQSVAALSSALQQTIDRIAERAVQCLSARPDENTAAATAQPKAAEPATRTSAER